MKLKQQRLEAWKASHKGWELNGDGILVPRYIEKSEIEKRHTGSSAIINIKAADVESSGKLDQGKKLTIAGVANEKATDRMDEVVNPAGLKGDAYSKNNILLAQHDHRMPIGLVTLLTSKDDGVHFEAWVGDPDAAPLTDCQIQYRSLIAQKILKAVSIGFIPLEFKMPTFNDSGNIEQPAEILSWEMLELSVVSVPCNAGALFNVQKSRTPAAIDPFAGFKADEILFDVSKFQRLKIGGGK